jgi:hypothetical protein
MRKLKLGKMYRFKNATEDSPIFGHWCYGDTIVILGGDQHLSRVLTSKGEIINIWLWASEWEQVNA